MKAINHIFLLNIFAYITNRCSECIRAFQLESQRNITIVDLDDEADESTDASNKPAEQNKNGKDEASIDANAKAEDEQTAEGTQSNATSSAEKAATEDGEEKPESQTNGAEAIEATTTEKKDAEAMDVDVEGEDAAKAESSNNATNVQIADSSVKSTEVVATTIDDTKTVESSKPSSNTTTDAPNLSDPSLLELLNWLDNPPTDLTCASEFCITIEDFMEAVKVVQPSSKREGFITVPDVTWADVGSLQDIREELQLAVLAPVKFPEKLLTLGLTAPSGVLLCGPPGCGKTLLAKAIANEAGINFISVKGPELMNMVCTILCFKRKFKLSTQYIAY